MLANFAHTITFEVVALDLPKIVEGFQPRRCKCKQRPTVAAQFEQIEINIMKLFNRICRPAIRGLVLAALVAIPSALRADGTNSGGRATQMKMSSAELAKIVTGTNAVASNKPIPYPLTTCVVSGEKLGGDMGPPIVFVYQDAAKGINQEIKFCCPMCKPDFLKDPDKYMKIIQAAEAKAKAKDAKN
jgi:hypothetical protein